MKIKTKLVLLFLIGFVLICLVSVIVIRVSVANSLGAVDSSLMQTLFFITIFGVALIIGIALLFAWRRIFKPLEKLIGSFNRVADGELMHRAELTSNDEMGRLSQAFNNLAENLSNNVHEVRAVNIKLDSHSRELKHRVERRTRELSASVEKYKQEAQERKQVETRLKMLDLAIMQSIDGVVIINQDDSIRFANRGWLKMHGRPLDSDEKMVVSDFHTSRQMKEEVSPFIKGLQEKGFNEAEVSHVRSDGTIFPTWMSSTQIQNEEGEAIGSVAIVRDITEAKAVENQLQEARMEAESANMAKSQFLANMSHEIRTPMNAIIGMSELVMDTELTPEQEDYVTTLKSSAESLLDLLNDILDLSKIEVGKLDIEPIEFNFRKTLATAVKNLVVQAQQKHIEVIYDVAWDIPSVLIGDPGRLRQIITNLIGNSIKFTSKGMVVLKASARIPEDESEQLLLDISVSDTGIGIPVEKQKLIFDKFTQTDSSITRKFGGSGLGLTISRQLVQLMKGEIGVHSPGDLHSDDPRNPGSTFYFSLPYKTPVKPNNILEPADINELKELPALVVDDNPINRQIYHKTLARWGMLPSLAEDGFDAMEILERVAKEPQGKQFQFVLMDIQMPGMDGFETIEKIKKTNRFNEIKYIVMTSSGLKGDGKRCRELGVSAYLKKPVPASQLLETLLMIRGGSGKRREREHLITRFSLNESRQKINILVAEDNLINQKLIYRVLEKRGFMVDIANNGRETVEKLEETTYDLVLMDIQMPEMDGIEATEMIRKREKEAGLTHIPIIALTAHAMKGDRERFLQAGMNTYISKPIKQKELLTVIEKLVRSKGRVKN